MRRGVGPDRRSVAGLVKRCRRRHSCRRIPTFSCLDSSSVRTREPIGFEGVDLAANEPLPLNAQHEHVHFEPLVKHSSRTPGTSSSRLPHSRGSVDRVADRLLLRRLSKRP